MAAAMVAAPLALRPAFAGRKVAGAKNGSRVAMKAGNW